MAKALIGNFKGPTGPPGPKGDPGEIAAMPSIGSNGNWFIGERDTGILADVDRAISAKIVQSTEISEPGFIMDGKTVSEEFRKLNSKLENSNSNLSNVKNTILTRTMNLAKGQNKIGDFVIPSGRAIVEITGTMKYNNAIFSLPMPMMEYAGGTYAEYGIELIYNNGSIFATSSSAWNNVTLRVVVWY